MGSNLLENGVKETELGPLPSEWQVVMLGQVCDFQGGTQPPKNTFLYEPTPGYVRLLQIRDFETAEHATYIPSDKKLRLVTENDVLIGRYGASVGKILRGLAGAINVAIVKTLPDQKRLDRNFFHYWLQTESFQSFLKSLGGRSAQAGFNKGELNQFQLGLPPLPEQRAIAHVLRTVQQAKQATEKVIAGARQLKQSLMRHLFTYGPVTFDQADQVALKETEVGPVPEHWRTGKLGDIGRIGNGSTPKRTNESFWKDGTIPWLTSGKVHERIIRQADEFVTKQAQDECHLPLVKKGSVVVAITGQGKTLGNAALVTFDTCVSQHLAYIQFENLDMDAEFVLAYLQQRYSHLREISSGGGSTKGALTCAFLKQYPLPVPSLQEQHKIACWLDVVEENIAAESERENALEALFQTLLHNLMTGKMRVHDVPAFVKAGGSHAYRR